MTSETQPSFFDEVQQLYCTAEDVLASLRCHAHSFKDLPAEADPVSYILSHANDFRSKFRGRDVDGNLITHVLRSYLEQTKSDQVIGLTDITDKRTSPDLVARNTTRYGHTVRMWNQQVYNERKEAIDAAAADLEQRLASLSVKAEELSRDVMEEHLYPVFDRSTFADVMTRDSFSFRELIPALVAHWHQKVYASAQIAGEDPGLLYDLSFQTIAEQRGWRDLDDQSLLGALAAENIPPEIFVHYTGWKVEASSPPKVEADSLPNIPPNIIPPFSTVQVRVDEDDLIFENIVCYDADGAETERYPQLRVMRDVYRYENRDIVFLNPYDAIVYAQEEGDFNPSSSLTVALLIAAYRGRQNADVNAFLEQYKDKGNGNGYHVLNTITQWQRGQARLIQYPHLADFPEVNRGTAQVNHSRPRRVMEFAVDNSFGDKLVSEVPAQSQFGGFLRNWYGLPDLGIIVEIGGHFSKPAKALVPNNPTTANYTSGAWLGCNNDHFNCYSGLSLDGNCAFRGVRRCSSPVGRRA
ncbi:hypothetical protein HY495_01990 [Candidatus Woesearchaeota archaeon]|nr:hypothetical protein [Candidatus Woesearchaeota archaeon]